MNPEVADVPAPLIRDTAVKEPLQKAGAILPQQVMTIKYLYNCSLNRITLLSLIQDNEVFPNSGSTL